METFQEVLDFIEPEQVGRYWFSGQSITPQSRIFGGQVLAQCLMAANKTVPEAMTAHSMHAYFLRAGDSTAPIEFEVDPIRDGRSFATRRVVARQHTQAIFNTSISYQVHEDGMRHTDRMPDVGARAFKHEPELTSEGKLRYPLLERYGVERMRAEDTAGSAMKVGQNNWYRGKGTLVNDPRVHQAALVLISDFSLLSTALRAHKEIDWWRDFMFASLDHSIWFHEPADLNKAVLYHCDSPWSGNARGFNRGQFWSSDGVLLASTTQEGLMRKKTR